MNIPILGVGIIEIRTKVEWLFHRNYKKRKKLITNFKSVYIFSQIIILFETNNNRFYHPYLKNIKLINNNWFYIFYF